MTFPRFNSTPEPLRIAQLSRECERTVQNYLENNDKISIEKIYRIIEEPLNQIEDIGVRILKSEENQEIIKEYELSG